MKLPDTTTFVHRSPESKLVFGNGSAATLQAELAAIGVSRPVVIGGRRTAASPLFEKVLRGLGNLPAAIYAEVPAHSSVATVREVCALARSHSADGFVAVGGGSASDTAKAASLWLAEGGELEDHASRFTPPDRLHIPVLSRPKLPIASVPSTASAAEVTPSLGIRAEDGRKLLFSDPRLASRLIVVDPEAALCVPGAILLSTGMNGLAHCLEGLYSKTRTPVTTALALHGTSLFSDALPAVARQPGSLAARSALMAAAHLSGLVLLNARTCLHHAICHAIGAASGAAHGDANSVILPHALRFNADAAQAELAEGARALGAPAASPAALIEAIESLQAEIGVPRRLRDIGVDRGLLARIAEKVMGERGLYFNPKPVADAGRILELLEAAW